VNISKTKKGIPERKTPFFFALKSLSNHCGDAVNKISTCGVAVISNPTVCDVCVFHAAVFGEMKLFAVLGFFNYLSQPKFDQKSITRSLYLGLGRVLCLLRVRYF